MLAGRRCAERGAGAQSDAVRPAAALARLDAVVPGHVPQRLRRRPRLPAGLPLPPLRPAALHSDR